MSSLDNDVLPVQTIDVDIIIKVLSNTILSERPGGAHRKDDDDADCNHPGPFFAAWVPIFYKTQGLSWSSPIILYSSLYVVIVLALSEFFDMLSYV